MRQEILDFFGTLNLGQFTVSTELPWDASGVALYLKNPKKIYVDRDQSSVENVITTFDGLTLDNETTSVSVYFAADAKQLPPGYDDLITDLKTAKDTEDIQGVSQRRVGVSSEFQDDMLVTTLEFTFTKLIN